MKIKLSFVTNSSSASFTIQKKYLSEKQIVMIKGYEELAPLIKTKYDLGVPSGWTIKESKDEISVDTIMDNFNFFHYLKEIGIDTNRVDAWSSRWYYFWRF